MYDTLVNLVGWGLHAAHNGLEFDDAVFTMNRVAMGTFFVLSGYHKLFRAERHADLAAEMVRLKIPFPKFNEWFVPFWEFVGGILVVLGIFAPFGAVVLAIICLVAACTDGPGKVASYEPIDKADAIDDVLYLPEVLYIFGLALVVVAPGYGLLHLFG